MSISFHQCFPMIQQEDEDAINRLVIIVSLLKVLKDFLCLRMRSCALCVIFMILVSLENVKKCALGGCMITSKTKINVV